VTARRHASARRLRQHFLCNHRHPSARLITRNNSNFIFALSPTGR
jgi:hypothetical protein